MDNVSSSLLVKEGGVKIRIMKLKIGDLTYLGRSNHGSDPNSRGVMCVYLK